MFESILSLDHTKNNHMEFNIKDFLSFVNTIRGQKFRTLYRNLEFEVNTSITGLIYTPASTGIPRNHSRKFIERVAKRFSEIESFHPGDYKDISVNASYLLTLINFYLIMRDKKQ